MCPIGTDAVIDTDAVNCRYARRRRRVHRAHTALQELARRVQHHARRHDGRPCAPPRHRARASGSVRHRGRHHGLRESGRRDRPQHRAPDRDPGRLSRDDLRDDGESLLLVGPADDRDRRAAHHDRRGRDLRGGRRRIDLVRAERDEQVHAQRGLDPRAQAGAVLADAADGRIRGEDVRHLARAAGSVRRAEPASRRRGARRGKVQRRDRADDDDDEGRRQGDRRGVDERGDRRAGRRDPRGHDLRGRGEDQARRRGRRDLGRQREPVLGRRERVRRDERKGGGRAAA